MSVYRHKKAMLAIVDGLVDNTSFSRKTEAQRNSCFELAEELRHAIAAGERIERLEAALREVGELFRQAGNLSICTIQRPDDMTKLLEHGARVARKALDQ